MPRLRFEIWESSESLECAAVSESWDRLRDKEAVRREVFYASTFEEAMAHRNRLMGWESGNPAPAETDVQFTEQQVAEQEAYLKVRALD
jgi:hypothetical protein